MTQHQDQATESLRMPENGRRVPWDTSIFDMQAGDYKLDDERANIWFALPNDNPVHLSVSATGESTEHPVWKLTVHEDGSITLEPSINSVGTTSWHGFLEHGRWRTV